LILDEATSSIDPETESVIQYAIERLIAKRTSIIIAHRLSTIRHADRILVMHQGRVEEFGTHEELVQKEDGRYRQLYEMQFLEVATEE
ncbi:MAG: ABC transporter ATP-binding protein, partial [Saprospiraceae bacterium]|nr:ABC transporter ATP-binding protein [Saprospiraceae bacterium]MCB0626822.1 ABC transporter ATP-binding protein [Saprospiraceae bacterium]MCB0682851.1 ABC transporter ATP-binding protein [Saprospiraceae bacterium]